ncbi:uncharacterized protein LOC114314223 [Camellia sinensis]|uniref:uncharacterized protein LOC114314223 n=1 Tax=Camellia sinensis TaxID=4442 RepID=UPI0010366899|nr:uncharacterized protein LOC114314223 [Camellia sinensis]
MKSTRNVRVEKTLEIEDKDIEVLDDVGKEPADKSKKALKNILVQEDDRERFFLLNLGLAKEEEMELERARRPTLVHVEAVEEEVDKVLEAKAIREVNYLTWLSNTVVVKKNNGAGVVLVSPDGRMIEQSIRLGFKVSNNEVDYEVLIVGLKLAVAMEADEVVVFCDSQLIVN